MKTFYLTDSGRVREHNEDNLIIILLQSIQVWILLEISKML